MAERPTEIDEHSALSYKILQVLEDFIDEIGRRNCTARFDEVLTSRFYLKGRNLIQDPERFIEDHLVFPLLREALGHSIRPRPKQYAPRWPKNSGVPDFAVTSIPIEHAMDHDLRVFGEVKPPKKLENAEDDMTEYLQQDLDLHAVAFLTDGFDWKLWLRPKGVPLNDYDDDEPLVAEASLRNPLRAVQGRNKDVEKYNAFSVRNRVDDSAFSAFTAEALETILTENLNVPPTPQG